MATRRRPQERTVQIRFTTSTYAPGNQVTLLCQDSLGGTPVFGEYAGGAWRYTLRLGERVTQVAVDFQLNQSVTRSGGPVHIDLGAPAGGPLTVPARADGALCFDEGQIWFEGGPSRYAHGIERLVTEDTDFQRRYIPANLDQEQEYDAIVIGSGMGGGILADALSDQAVHVLVLEAGSVHLPQNIVNLPVPNIVRTAVPYAQAAGSAMRGDVCINFGGRSVYWSALIPRMNTWEMRWWPAPVVKDLAHNGGYDRAEVVFRKRTEFGEYERRLRLDLGLHLPSHLVDHLPRSFHSSRSVLPRPLGDLDEVATGTFSTAALLLNSLSAPGAAGRDNLTVNLNHLVTRMELDGDRAVAVVCQDVVHHCERRYRAKHIILAAGATESPRIAIQSGVADRSKKIGKGLTGHQWSELAFTIPPGASRLSVNDRAKLLLLPRDMAVDERQFSCELTLNTRPWEVRYEDDDLLEQQIRAARKSGESAGKLKFMFGSALDEENWVGPGSDGRHTVFVKAMAPALFERSEPAQQLKDEVLRYFEVDEVYRKRGLQHETAPQSHHVGGSLRTGDDERHSVVDSDLRFHQYDNLYCCDLSVFPHIPVANPSLTLGALALRLARHISKQVKKAGKQV